MIGEGETRKHGLHAPMNAVFRYSQVVNKSSSSEGEYRHTDSRQGWSKIPV